MQAAPASTALIGHPTGAVLAIGAAGLVLAGCSGGGGGGGGDSGPPPPALTFTGLALTVTTDVPATVTVNGQAGASVAFGTVANPSDPGANRDSVRHDLVVAAAAGGTSAQRSCSVTVNPSLASAAAVVSLAEARHLTGRTGCGATPEELLRWAGLGWTAAVDQLLAETRTAGFTTPPPWISAVVPTWPEYNAWTQAERDAYETEKQRRIKDLKVWWLNEMVVTPSPFTERLVLFWSNLLVTSATDVGTPTASWRYLALLRTHAAGNVRALFEAICRDPAMVMYLDNDTNVKGKPNENFARELQELFALGEGRVYTEADVVAAARAFTGWNLDDRRNFLFKSNQHDVGAKTFLGQTGTWDGGDILRILFEQPRLAVHLVERLWHEFAGDDHADPAVAAEIDRLAAVLRSTWEMKPLLRELLLSPLFIAASRRNSQLKSPIVLLVGLWRSLGIPPSSVADQIDVLAGLEQNPLDPPNVRGWIGGTDWIHAKSLLDRRFRLGQAAAFLAPKLAPGALADLPARLLPITPLTAIPASPALDRVKAVLLDPAFQLQ